MKALIDGNILLDVLQNRSPHVEASAQIWKLCETDQIEGFVSALTFADLVYIMRKELTPDSIHEVLKKLAIIFRFTDLSVSDMTLAVSGSSLQVTNTDGTNSFTLTDLANMQFSKDGSTVSALGRVLDAERPVTAFSMTGVSLGTFGDLMETARTLPAGAYVIKQGNNTQTIVLK